jgi:hypothetical protein
MATGTSLNGKKIIKKGGSWNVKKEGKTIVTRGNG